MSFGILSSCRSSERSRTNRLCRWWLAGWGGSPWGPPWACKDLWSDLPKLWVLRLSDPLRSDPERSRRRLFTLVTLLDRLCAGLWNGDLVPAEWAGLPGVSPPMYAWWVKLLYAALKACRPSVGKVSGLFEPLPDIVRVLRPLERPEEIIELADALGRKTPRPVETLVGLCSPTLPVAFTPSPLFRLPYVELCECIMIDWITTWNYDLSVKILMSNQPFVVDHYPVAKTAKTSTYILLNAAKNSHSLDPCDRCRLTCSSWIMQLPNSTSAVCYFRFSYRVIYWLNLLCFAHCLFANYYDYLHIVVAMVSILQNI